MRHQTPYLEDNFMAEPTPLRLVGNYGVAGQDAEAIAAALLTATMWFQTTSRRPDVFEGMFIAPKMKKRIFQLAQAAERHPIFQADAGLLRSRQKWTLSASLPLLGPLRRRFQRQWYRTLHLHAL